MKALAGFGFFLLFLAGIALVQLAGRTPEAASERPAVLADVTGRDWRGAAMKDLPVAVARATRLHFTTGGQLLGDGPCSRFAGTYELEDGRLTLRDIGVDTAACDSAGQAADRHWQLLLQSSVQLTTDGRQLILLGADGTRLARFRTAE